MKKISVRSSLMLPHRTVLGETKGQKSKTGTDRGRPTERSGRSEKSRHKDRQMWSGRETEIHSQILDRQIDRQIYSYMEICMYVSNLIISI